MGKVTVKVRIENMGDLHDADHGRIASSDVRGLEIPDALVDTGATGLHVPKTQLAMLGLKQLRSRIALTAAAEREVRVFGPVRLTIEGRNCPMDISELPDGCPALIGQIPLEAMDFVVDPKNQKIIGNPAHGGVEMIEIYTLLAES